VKAREGYKVTEEEFAGIVDAVVSALPGEFRERMGDIAVIVEAEPSRELLREARMRKGDDLFGFFRGAPLPDTSFFDLPRLPGQIFIFRRALERAFPDRKVLTAEIRKTILHELGHYFGMSEKELRRMGYG
jgi:predicted Zn-dependent protease with MMP-like domain